MDRDRDQLNLLAIFHYVVAAILGLTGFAALIYVAAGVVMLSLGGEFGGKGGPPPAFLGWILIAVGALIGVLFWSAAAANVYSGRCLARRRRRLLCFTVAICDCMMFVPYGTLLGIFTIVVLVRPSVIRLFEDPPPTMAAP